jgi:formylglycine-generating enzyme required for sulfatase activity
VEELTLRPGKYQIEATKDGQQVKRELVSISRNGRTVVRMSLESSHAAARSKDPATGAGWHGWPAEAPSPAIAPFDADQAKAHQEAWAKHLGVPVEYTNSLGMKFRLIPPGEFLMGTSVDEVSNWKDRLASKRHTHTWIDSEAPAKRVVIDTPFYMECHEVTIGQFEKFAAETQYQTLAETNGTGGVRYDPEVNRVRARPQFTWRYQIEEANRNEAVGTLAPRDIDAFVEWLSAHEKHDYRVPTEAQWEFSCRAGTTTPWFCSESELPKVSWHDLSDIHAGNIHPVGTKAPNPFGLFDVYGNIEEYAKTGEQWIARGIVDPHPALLRSAARSEIFFPNSGPYFLMGMRLTLSVDSVRSSLREAPPTTIAPFDADQAKAHQAAWAKYLGVPVEKQIVLGRDQRGLDVKLTMILVPPGEFVMGSSDEHIKTLREQAIARGVNRHDLDWIELEGPQRRVRLTRPFYLGQHEFTTEQFRAFVDATGYRTEPETDGKGAWPPVGDRSPDFHWQRVKGQGSQSPDSPVVNITWNDANRCCEWLSRQAAGLRFALPTEAQWEYACRAGTTTLWSTGDEESSLENHAVINARWTRDVGGRLPNPFGLCDMHGNVWEYCQDAVYNYRDAGTVDPIGATDGERRIIRGGGCFGAIETLHSWMEKSGCRSAVRLHRLPDNPLLQIGFRVTAAIPDDVIQATVGRNLKASLIQETAIARPPAIAPTDDWQPLFNGRDLTGWKTLAELPGQWEVKDGLLIGSAKPSYLFSERGDFANFHLRAEIKV